MKDQSSKAKIAKLNGLVEKVCGIYSRIARRLGVHRTFVSRVARGERQSQSVEDALAAEYDRVSDSNAQGTASSS
jgi:DNA-binding transcriptional regulator YdaS (Cro superfamily)